MSLVIVLKIELKRQTKIMIIGHYAGSIIAHCHTSNMVAIFSYYTPGEPKQHHLAILIQ